MPDIKDGLTFGEDPNTSEGFQANLAAAVGGELTDEQREAARSSDRSVAAGLTQPGSEEAGEQATPATPEPEQAPPAEEESIEVLRARLEEKDKFIGQQSNEIGEWRAREAARQEAERQAAPEQEQPRYDLNSALGQINNLSETRGWSEAMNWAIENSPELIDHTLRSWLEEGDPEATLFASKMYAYEAAQEAAKGQEAEQPKPDPYLEQVRANQMAQNVQAAVFADVPDAEREALGPHLAEALNDVDETFKAGLFNPETTAQYAKYLVDMGRARFYAAATEQAGKTQDVAVRAAKVAAGAATGSQTPGVSGDLPKLSQEQFDALPPEQRAAIASKFFGDQVLNTHAATSIAHGLEYPKKG